MAAREIPLALDFARRDSHAFIAIQALFGWYFDCVFRSSG
jgi:hypothetical protein